MRYSFTALLLVKKTSLLKTVLHLLFAFIGTGTFAQETDVQHSSPSALYKKVMDAFEEKDLVAVFENAPKAMEAIADSMSKENHEYWKLLYTYAYSYIRLKYTEPKAYPDLKDTVYLEMLHEMASISKRTKLYEDQNISLKGLVVYYTNKAQYRKAEKHIKTSLLLIEENEGRSSENYLWMLNQLGVVYLRWQKYDRSVETFSALEKFVQKKHGKYSSSLAKTYNNLGDAYYSLNQVDRAKAAYQAALSVYDSIPREGQTMYAKALRQLISLDPQSYPFKQRIKAYQEIKAVYENHPGYGPQSSAVADILWDMAYTCRINGDLQNAKKYVTEGAAIIKSKPNKGHYLYGDALIQEARILLLEDSTEQAFRYYEQADTILLNNFGQHHSRYFRLLNEKAIAYAKQKSNTKAIANFEKSVNLQNAYNLRTSTYLTEKEMQQNIAMSQRRIDRFYTAFEDKFLLGALAYDNALFHKGFLLESILKIKQVKAHTTDTTTLALFEKWTETHRKLEKQFSSGSKDSLVLAALENEAQAAEKQLIKNVRGFLGSRQVFKWRDIQQALRPGEAAIEFIRYDHSVPNSTDSVFYAAIVLRKGDTQPHFVSLFEEKKLKSIIDKHFKQPNSFINELYASSSRGRASVDGTVPVDGAESLFRVLWKPLNSLLQNTHTVYYSPSGIIHRLSLDAIQIDDTLCLADRFHLVRLGSTRGLLEKNRPSIVANHAILYGGIEFDLDTSKVNIDPHASADSSLIASFPRQEDSGRSNRSIGNFRWLRLSKSLNEVQNIQSSLESKGFTVRLHSGAKASEETFQQIGTNLSPPRILHLATHGYFFPDPKDSLTYYSENDPVFKTTDHPLIRSGIILAGANHVWTGKKPLKGLEDGILTAYDISQMNLENTELVVLSACDTGLGDIEGNEGVYGLQRAFKIAGVKYIIMSLWEVPDNQTKTFMSMFYKNWIEKGMNLPDAFRATQHFARHQREWTTEGWAGFVLFE